MTAMIHADFLNHSITFKRALTSSMEIFLKTHFKYKLVSSCTFGTLFYMCAVLWFPQSACSFSFIFNSEQTRLGDPEWYWCQMVWKYAKAENINVPVLGTLISRCLSLRASWLFPWIWRTAHEWCSNYFLPLMILIFQ